MLNQAKDERNFKIENINIGKIVSIGNLKERERERVEKERAEFRVLRKVGF